MNLGRGRWNSRYICDKCKKEIPFIKQKGYVGIHHYSKATQRETYKKTFDLCAECEKKLRIWLNTIEIINYKPIDRFPIYKDEEETNE